MNPLTDTFDDFVDDLLSSDVDLLLLQHVFNSIDLKIIKPTEFCDNDSLAA